MLWPWALQFPQHSSFPEAARGAAFASTTPARELFYSRCAPCGKSSLFLRPRPLYTTIATILGQQGIWPCECKLGVSGEFWSGSALHSLCTGIVILRCVQSQMAITFSVACAYGFVRDCHWIWIPVKLRDLRTRYVSMSWGWVGMSTVHRLTLVCDYVAL